MKGLLYKEWCLGKKTCGLFLILSLLFCLLGILVFLSMICGNLRAWPDEEPESVKVFSYIFYYVPYILILLASSCITQSIFTDYDSGWMKYSYTIPQKPIKVIGAKYVYVGIIFVISFILGLLNAVVISLMSHKTLSIDVFKNMLIIFLLAVCGMAIVTPLAFLLKKSSTLCAIGAGFVIVFYVMAGFAIMKIEKNNPENIERILKDILLNIRETILRFAIVIIIIMVTLSLFISTKIYQRREKQ